MIVNYASRIIVTSASGHRIPVPLVRISYFGPSNLDDSKEAYQTSMRTETSRSRINRYGGVRRMRHAENPGKQPGQSPHR